MAKFPNMVMTKQGLDMLIRQGSGKDEDRLIIVGVRLGDGNFDGNIRDLEDVVSPKLDVPLAEYKNIGNGKAEVTCTFTNDKINIGFYHREVGLLAKNGENGAVKLLNYSNAGNYTSYLPDKTEPIPIQTLKIGVTIGDAQNVDGHIDFNSAVTVEMLNTAIAAHNTSDSAHENLFAEKLNKSGDTATGLLQLAQTLITNLSTNIPADDNSGKLVPSAWVQNLLAALATNTVVTWDGDNFSCPALDIHGLIAKNGYVNFGKLFGGFIWQWGIANPIIGADGTCTLPIAFPTAFISVIICAGYTAGSGTIGYACANPASSQTFIYRENAGLSPNYIAIGR